MAIFSYSSSACERLGQAKGTISARQGDVDFEEGNENLKCYEKIILAFHLSSPNPWGELAFLYDRAASLAETLGYSEKAVEYILQGVCCHLQKGDYSNAASKLEEVQWTRCFEEGCFSYSLGWRQKMIRLLTDTIEPLLSFPILQNSSSFFNHLAVLYHALDMPAISSMYFEKLAHYYSTQEVSEKAASFFYAAGEQKARILPLCQKTIFKSIELFKKASDAYGEIKDYMHAKQSLEKAARQYFLIQDFLQMANCFYKIAICYSQCKLDKIEYFQKASTYSVSAGSYEFSALCLVKASVLFFEKKDHKETAAHQNKAAIYYYRAHNLLSSVLYFSQAGHSYKSLARQNPLLAGYSKQAASNFVHAADLYAELGQYEKAIEHIKYGAYESYLYKGPILSVKYITEMAEKFVRKEYAKEAGLVLGEAVFYLKKIFVSPTSLPEESKSVLNFYIIIWLKVLTLTDLETLLNECLETIVSLQPISDTMDYLQSLFFKEELMDFFTLNNQCRIQRHSLTKTIQQVYMLLNKELEARIICLK